jgi:hypothetical protein
MSVGIIKELPITLCKSDDFSKNTPLIIVNADTPDSNLPIQITHVSEINLFFESATGDVPEKQTGIAPTHLTITSAGKYTRPAPSIFHPPS